MAEPHTAICHSLARAHLTLMFSLDTRQRPGAQKTLYIWLLHSHPSRQWRRLRCRYLRLYLFLNRYRYQPRWCLLILQLQFRQAWLVLWRHSTALVLGQCLLRVQQAPSATMMTGHMIGGKMIRSVIVARYRLWWTTCINLMRVGLWTSLGRRDPCALRDARALVFLLWRLRKTYRPSRIEHRCAKLHAHLCGAQSVVFPACLL